MSLLEVLIAVLVLAIGLLGIAALQATALRNSQSSLERNQAVIASYTIADAMTDPHFRDRRVIVDVEDRELGKVPMHNILPRLSATPDTWQRSAPGLGEHTDAILTEAGFDRDAIARLRASGAAA